MKANFGRILQKYFRDFLPNDRGASPRTISTYRYAFIQFIEYMETCKDTAVGEISMSDFTSQNTRAFLRWLENEKKTSVSTSNQRLAALKSFASFAKYEYPEFLSECEQIAKIKAKAKEKKTVKYLSSEGIGLVLRSIDKNTPNGLRDYTILLLMFLTGIRVSELIGIKCRDVVINSPKYIVIHGKGGKNRHVPIVRELNEQLQKYRTVVDFTHVKYLDTPLFRNHSGSEFTRQGINYILAKYVGEARKKDENLIPLGISPHKIRHSTAMSLVDEGTELIVIRDLLGHSSIQTTEIYAKLSSDRKRKAIEEASAKIVPEEEAQWERNPSIKDWLRSFK